METEKYKTKLLAEKKLLEEELGSLGKVDKKGDWEATPEQENSIQEVQDEADMADRSEDYQERSSVLNTLEERLASVNLALEKVDRGEYGVCEKCHKKISSERLEANPAAPTCEDCM
jgi:DnaK suppressor protein